MGGGIVHQSLGVKKPSAMQYFPVSHQPEDKLFGYFGAVAFPDE
jgi:hypothetical protein